MSDVASALRSGDVSAALALAQAGVRARPAETAARAALIEVQLVLGQWDKALTQLGVIESLDAGTLPFARTCQVAIHCERLRESVYRGERGPLVVGEPPAWLAQLLQANRLLAEGNVAAAADLRAQALESAPASSGTLNGASVEWVADMDSRVGPVYELFVDAKYYWVPMERVRRLTFPAPADVRDLIWLPVEVIWETGGEKVALMPVRYPGTERSTDPDLLLGRRTDWTDLGNDTYCGLGQRLFCTDVGEFASLDLRDLQLSGSA